MPLLGRDLLCKLRAQISFSEDGSMHLKYGKVNLDIPREEVWRLMVAVDAPQGGKWMDFAVPHLWAEDNPPGYAGHHPPIVIEEIPRRNPVRIRQRAYPRHIVASIQKVIETYLTYGILVPIDSPWNTPILPIPKGDGHFRMAQDLRRVNDATVTIHATVPNPYVLLGLIPPTASWFSVIDLKDAFFTIPIHHQSQHLFAFEWESPITGRKQQYTWTRLPQGFKNSPTLFGAALARDLEALEIPPPDVVLQYVDDLLVTGTSEDVCWENTSILLHLLQDLGYKASKKKAQLVLPKVRYLGYDIQQGSRTLAHERKEAICQLPVPKNRKELRGFLGAAGFCRIWIPNFAILAKPLYEATKGADKEPLKWEKGEQQSFTNLKLALTQAPTLALPDLEKPFQLFVDTKQNMAVGVLTQRMGTWFRPVAYLSKQLDNVAKGWPTCLKAVAGAALLTHEANKLTFGHDLEIHTPHTLRAVLDNKGHLWLTNPRMLKYQAMLTHNPSIRLVHSNVLNPATLLPEPDSQASHDCLQTIEETFSSRPDLKDVPLVNPDYTLYTDGSSFLHDGVRKAGYAVVTLEDVWEAQPLPPGTSAQLAELHALTRALEMSYDLRVNIYTDSKYAFLTVQVHGALYKERGMLTAGGKDIKYGSHILRLLDSVWAPREVAIMHCRGHQKGVSDIDRGNNKADRTARSVALAFLLSQTLCPLWTPPSTTSPSYTPVEVTQAKSLEASLVDGWFILPDDRVFVPQQLAWDVASSLHQQLHLGKSALAQALLREVYIDKVHSLATNVVLRCSTCAANNPRQGPSLPQGHQPKGCYPFESLMIDFTDMPRSGPYTAMLVIVCTYTGWPEAIPTRTKKAAEVTKALLQVVIPRYGLPTRISSDNGPEFVHQATQKISRMLGINWRLHCSFHPSSGGFVERFNRTIKDKVAKICQETHLKWPDALNMALLAVRCAPRKTLNVSPFELLYGRIPNLVAPAGLHLTTPQLGDTLKWKQLQALNAMVRRLQTYVLSCRPHVIVTPVHNIKPGQEVWVKHWKQEPLAPKWKGPYTVVMSSPLAVKVAEVKSWIHWTRVKLAAPGSWSVSPDPVHPLKLAFVRLPLARLVFAPELTSPLWVSLRKLILARATTIFVPVLAPVTNMDSASRLRDTARIRRYLVPSVWLMTVLLFLCIVINTMYLFKVFYFDRHPGLSPISDPVNLTGWDDSLSPGGNGVPVDGHGPFPPCSQCFLYLPNSIHFTYSQMRIPECQMEEGLSPCEHKGRRFWRCRLPLNGTLWDSWDGYNSTVMCHVLDIPWTPKRSPRRARSVSFTSSVSAASSPLTLAWDRNSYFLDVQNISRIVNKTDCWICMHVPPHAKGGLIIHAIPFNKTIWFQNNWKWYRGRAGILQSDDVPAPVLAVASRIQEEAAFCWEFTNTTGTASLAVGKYPNCRTTFVLTPIMYRNNTYLNGTYTEYLHNFTEFACTNQLTGGCSISIGCPNYQTSRELAKVRTSFPLCNIIRAMVRQVTAEQNHTINIIGDFWMLCGRRAYQRIPPWWSGRCTLGHVAPSVIISDSRPKGRLRNRRDTDVQQPINYYLETQLSRAALPPLGVAMNYRDLHALSNWTTVLFNDTIKALKMINVEIAQIREVVLQNRYALDIILAAKGGVCALIHSHCCVYITDYKVNISATVHHMETVVAENPIDTTVLQSPWDWLWSWLPDFGWVKRIIPIAFSIIIALVGCCCCIQCIPGLLSLFRPRFRLKKRPPSTTVLYAWDVESDSPYVEVSRDWSN
ncbi:uncharacterized protein LOC131195016 [Ahaetulla prasina]|uniref:uncharacterized protein LOC131195016 n=1 Tax=Ahaetulla prasina TaxID=499056 RepID=UPI0026474421|nr:uncharacterized protein LOC131195016 [Ahaetulla prasina]